MRTPLAREKWAPSILFKNWLRDGGAHNIAVQLLIGKGLQVKPRNQKLFDTGRASEAASDMTWLNAMWRQLVRRSKGEIKSSDAPEMAPIFERTDWLACQQNRNGDPRHPVERIARNESHSNTPSKFAAPLQPRQTRNAVSPSLLRLLRELSGRSC